MRRSWWTINQLVLDAENKTAKLNAPYMSLDLGGVAKGYACDLAREKYKELGLTSCLLSLGGNIYSFGTKADGTAFVIGLRDPLGDADRYFWNCYRTGQGDFNNRRVRTIL